MKRKIFISLNIPDKVKKRLIKTIEKWHDLPMKWTRESNLHITLVFLGFVDEETIPEICQKVREATENEEIFDVEFDQIELFPSADNPRMVALTGPTSEELLNIVNKLENALNISMADKKSFRPHITLGRSRKYKWEALGNKPSVEEKFNLLVSAETIDVMASDFGDGGQEYVTIESCALK